MTSSLPDKNIGQTFGFTDDDIIEGLGLNPSLKGTDGINTAAKAAVHEQIKLSLMTEGMTPEAAAKEATRIQSENM